MLRTLDILIGVATVMLLFSMAVTIITQFVAAVMQSRGKNLQEGLAGLLQQIDPKMKAEIASKIATVVLKHPLVAGPGGKLGEIVQREEFTPLLLGLAAGESAATLEDDAKTALLQLLKNNGISDPGATLKNIRAAALQLEVARPELANDIRHGMAILQEAKSEFVGKVHGWFDQTIDRVGARFTLTARMVTFIAALLVAITVQLDTFALIDRLSVDEQFRASMQKNADTLMAQAAKAQQAPDNAATPTPTPSPTPNGADAQAPSPKPSPTSTPSPAPTATPASSPAATGSPAGPPAPTSSPTPTATESIQLEYYNLLSTAGLVTLPGQHWCERMNWGKIPGILLSALLLSLGAPFWYGRLQDLLRLRSALAQKDDQQRTIRQTTQSPGPADDSSGKPDPVVLVAMQGEQGDTNAVG
jgi:hypothetical protein